MQQWCLHPNYIINCLKVKYPLHFFVSHAQPSMNQELLDVIKVATMKTMNGAVWSSYIIYCLKMKYPLCFIVSYCMFNLLVQIKHCSKSNSVIKVAALKNMDDFHYAQEDITAINWTPFTISKNEWNTKENTDKSTVSQLIGNDPHYLFGWVAWAYATPNAQLIQLFLSLVISLVWYLV